MDACKLLSFYYLQFFGRTALHRASGANQTAVVTLLLDHGADVHAVDYVSMKVVLLDGRVRGKYYILYTVHGCRLWHVHGGHTP